jgi:hypothetical protein
LVWIYVVYRIRVFRNSYWWMVDERCIKLKVNGQKYCYLTVDLNSHLYNVNTCWRFSPVAL